MKFEMPCDSRFSEYDNTHFNLSAASIVISEGHDNILHDTDMLPNLHFGKGSFFCSLIPFAYNDLFNIF